VAATADALDFAHRKGFVHRDLKLANVLLDKKGRPYVADFGLAVVWNDGVDRDGERRGSAAYAALESSLGMGRRLDWRSDVFSAGVILYELLAGKALLSRDGLEGAMVDAFNLEWRRLWFPRDVPRVLRDICAKCLARDPNNRYHTAGHLSSALNSFLAEVSHGKKITAVGR
jgi:serine/threonine protein kinase